MDQFELNNQIIQLLVKNPKSVHDHYWVKESLRYQELLFSLLYAAYPEKSRQCRSAIITLAAQNILDPLTISNGNNKKISDSLTISTLVKTGFSKAEAKKAQSIIVSCARIIGKNYQGKIQFLLRIFGEVLKNELLLTFKNVPVTKSNLELALSLWMQNALNIPLSIKSQDILEFCKENKIRINQLTQAADELDINIALLDDIIIAHRTKTLKRKNHKKNKTRKV